MYLENLLYSSVEVLAYANVNMFIFGFSSPPVGRNEQSNNAEEAGRWIQNNVTFKYVRLLADYI